MTAIRCLWHHITWCVCMCMYKCVCMGTNNKCKFTTKWQVENSQQPQRQQYSTINIHMCVTTKVATTSDIFSGSLATTQPILSTTRIKWQQSTSGKGKQPAAKFIPHVCVCVCSGILVKQIKVAVSCVHTVCWFSLLLMCIYYPRWRLQTVVIITVVIAAETCIRICVNAKFLISTLAQLTCACLSL